MVPMVTIVSLTICQIILTICRIYGHFFQKCLLFISGADCQASWVLKIIGDSGSSAMSGLGIDLPGSRINAQFKVGNVYGL